MTVKDTKKTDERIYEGLKRLNPLAKTIFFVPVNQMSERWGFMPADLG